MNGRVLGTGEGPSRRIAETSAAAQALDALRAERLAAKAARADRTDDASEDPDPDADADAEQADDRVDGSEAS